MELHKSSIKHLKQIMAVIDDAKSAMNAMGIDQWQNGDPDAAAIESDIKNGNSYVVTVDNKILAHGTLIFGIEPTYNKIVFGEWKSDLPYATIHRAATLKEYKKTGVASFIFSSFEKICLEKGVCWLRIDTHRDNIPMQNLIQKSGFDKSGTIYLSSGAERIAYEKKLKF